MTARKAVADVKLTDESLGRLHRRFGEIVRRTDEMTLDHPWVMNRLQRVIEGRQQGAPFDWNWDIWKTIRLGMRPIITSGAGTHFVRDLEGRSWHLGDWVYETIKGPNFSISATESDLGLVVATPRELDAVGVSDETGYEIAREFGLETCPAETSLQILAQHPRHIGEGSSLYVAMAPVASTKDGLCVLYLYRDDGNKYLMQLVVDQMFRHPEARIVFTRAGT